VTRELNRETLDRLAIHGGGSVTLGCADHDDGTNAIYQDGVVRVLCRTCGFEGARVKAAASTQPPSPQAEVQDGKRPSDLDWNATSGAVFTNGELWELRAFALQAGADKISKGSFARRALDRLNFVLGATGTGKQPPAEPQGDVVEGDLVERIARQIYGSGWCESTWPEAHEKVQHRYRDLARKLIAESRSSLAQQEKAE